MARIMSRVEWTPVADGMPRRGGGHFKQGTEYTGVPYSSVKAVGRCIGFDIYLKTFLAAVENPHSVLYTEDLTGKVSNAAPYYGKVCSSFTSYALQCAIPYRSSHHDTQFRSGVVLVDPQSAQAAMPGDVIYTPPAKVGGGSHVELVTAVEKKGEKVTAVRVEDSWPPTTRNLLREASNFNSHISSRNRRLYRITDFDAWHEQNKAESFLFPEPRRGLCNAGHQSRSAARPRRLGSLLPRPASQIQYHGQRFPSRPRRSSSGAGDTVVEQIDVKDKGVIERLLPDCGDYTAHCVMGDGSLSQACEFSVCRSGSQSPCRATNPRQTVGHQIHRPEPARHCGLAHEPQAPVQTLHRLAYRPGPPQ